jgi:hypothetical protein
MRWATCGMPDGGARNGPADEMPEYADAGCTCHPHRTPSPVRSCVPKVTVRPGWCSTDSRVMLNLTPPTVVYERPRAFSAGVISPCIFHTLNAPSCTKAAQRGALRVYTDATPADCYRACRPLGTNVKLPPSAVSQALKIRTLRARRRGGSPVVRKRGCRSRRGATLRGLVARRAVTVHNRAGQPLTVRPHHARPNRTHTRTEPRPPRGTVRLLAGRGSPRAYHRPL